MKYFIRVFFLLFFCIILLYINNVLLPKRTMLPLNTSSKVKGFYSQPKNSLDIIFIGSSHAYCSFNPAVIYKESGIKSYVFAANEQPLWTSYYYIKEALKYQKPKAIVLEMLYISEEKKFKREGLTKVNIDDINLFPNKYDMTKASEKGDIMDIFPIYRYHNRWKHLGFNDFKSHNYGFLKGYTPLYKQNSKSIKINKQNILPLPLPSKSNIYLKKIIAYCKEKKVPLIFAYAPYQVSKKRLGHIETLKKIARDENIRFYNFMDSTLLSSIGFDLTKDMDRGHLNINGAKKVSKYLAHELKQIYSFTKEASNDYIKLVECFEVSDSLPKIKTLDSYTNYLKDKDVYIFVAAKDEASQGLTTQLKDLGSKTDWKKKFRWGYIGIFNPQKNEVTEIIKDEKITYKKIMNQEEYPFKILIESAGNTNGNNAKIFISGKDFLNEKKGRGLNFVIYNHFMNKVIDIAYFDTHAKKNPVRDKKGG